MEAKVQINILVATVSKNKRSREKTLPSVILACFIHSWFLFLQSLCIQHGDDEKNKTKQIIFDQAKYKIFRSSIKFYTLPTDTCCYMKLLCRVEYTRHTYQPPLKPNVTQNCSLLISAYWAIQSEPWTW